MKTIYKYNFPVTTYFELSLPEGAKILHVEVQHDTPCLWALVDTRRESRSNTFYLAPTGGDIGDDSVLEHVGTFLMHGGDLVWHLFRVRS